jgi:hypothetical protein
MTDQAAAGEMNIWRGAFGEAWVATVCRAAKLVPWEPPLGLDLEFVDLMVRDPVLGEQLMLQIKTTESPGQTAAGYTFDLEVPAYNALRSGSSRGFLVLVVAHDPQPAWTAAAAEGSAVRATAYIKELTGQPPTTNTSTVTVTFPPDTMLTQAHLAALLEEDEEDVA